MQNKPSACVEAQRQRCTGTAMSAADVDPNFPEGIRLDLSSASTLIPALLSAAPVL